MTHHGRVAISAGHLNGLNGFSECPDLVDLDQNTVRNTFLDSFSEASGIGYEEIVADELAAVTNPIGHLLPAIPVVFTATIFD